MATTTGTWWVRGAGREGAGRAVPFSQLAQAVADNVVGENDEVRGPTDAQFVIVGDHPQLEEYLPLRPVFVPKEAEDAEMDMTPMIDVTFQLLIFFMITAAFVVQKTLDMPQADQNKEEEPIGAPTLSQLAQENIVVSVKIGGTISVDGQTVSVTELGGALKKAYESKKEPELILDIEDDVDHDMVVKVIDGAAGAEIQKIHFVRRSGGSGSSPGPPAAAGAAEE